jgi:hypothetical protein
MRIAKFLESIVVVIVLGAATLACGQSAVGPDSSPEEDRTKPAEATFGQEETITGQPTGPDRVTNQEPVPDVVGMPVMKARQVIRRNDYRCAVVTERAGDAGPRRVVAQRPNPGEQGYVNQVVRLTVSRPFPRGKMPVDCLDRRE